MFMENVLLLVTIILSLVLQSDCKDFSSARQSLTFTLRILEDMSNDKNSIHFQSSEKFKKIVLETEQSPASSIAVQSTQKSYIQII